KLEMIDFVRANTLPLSKHQRILTTGTTGTLLKLLFASSRDQELLLQELAGDLEGRLGIIALDILNEMEIRPKKTDLRFLLERLREERGITDCSAFVEKIVVLPSGPAGGDVLIAEAVLQNECHSIVFLHDPLTAHPHSADIRLLEHTSQLPGVFAECVSDRVSAEQWI